MFTFLNHNYKWSVLTSYPASVKSDADVGHTTESLVGLHLHSLHRDTSVLHYRKLLHQHVYNSDTRSYKHKCSNFKTIFFWSYYEPTLSTLFAKKIHFIWFGEYISSFHFCCCCGLICVFKNVLVAIFNTAALINLVMNVLKSLICSYKELTQRKTGSELVKNETTTICIFINPYLTLIIFLFLFIIYLLFMHAMATINTSRHK